MTEQTPQLTSFEPHHLRALHAWISENNLVPHILFIHSLEGVIFPVPPQPGLLAVTVMDVETREQFEATLQDDYQILNTSYHATPDVQFGEHGVSGTMRVQGRSTPYFIPYDAILRIYTRETRDIELEGAEGGNVKAPLISAGLAKLVYRLQETNSIPRSIELARKIRDGATIQAAETPKPETKTRPSFLSVVK